jgi:hypothetical protein
MKYHKIGQYDTLIALRNLLAEDVTQLSQAAAKSHKGTEGYLLLHSLADAKGDMLSKISSRISTEAAGAAPMSKQQYRTYQHLDLAPHASFSDLLNTVIRVEDSQLTWIRRMSVGKGLSRDTSLLIRNILTDYLRISDQLKRSASTKQDIHLQV